MALIVNKSMNVSDFWRCWKHIAALVEEEYDAVKGLDGLYDLRLELVWDCENEDEDGELESEDATWRLNVGHIGHAP